MKSTNITVFLEELHALYNASIQNNAIVQKAMLSKEDYVTVEQQTINGQVEQVTFPSFTYIQRQMSTFNQNLNALTTLQDGSSYASLVDTANGKVRQLFELSHAKQPFLNATDATIIQSDVVIDDKNDILKQIHSPNICLKLDITNATAQYSRHIELSKIVLSSYEAHKAHISKITSKTYKEVVDYLRTNNIAFTTSQHIINVDYYNSRYAGNFSILQLSKLNATDFSATLDTINYNDSMNSFVNSKELVVGDQLALLNQNSLYKVTAINTSTNVVTLQRVYGYTELLVGVSNLQFVDSNTKRTINLPLNYNDNGVYFIASTHIIHGTSSNLSKSFAYSTNELEINIDGVATKVNDYIRGNGGANLVEYLQNLVSQNSIPINYAIKPAKPSLTSDMLNVVQINKHIVEGSDVEYIKQLYAKQTKLADDIRQKNNTITEYKTALENSNYKNEADKKQLSNSMTKTIADVTSLQTQYAQTVNELSQKDIALYADTYAPKYRVRGLWPVEDSMQSEFTRDQHIIAYNVQYRYLSANDKIALSDTYTIKQEVNGEVVDLQATFSAWNELTTKPLQQVINSDGSITYEVNDIASTDQININQLDIPITLNEQVEIRVQAISEVGYPNVAVVSDWSDTIKVKFPKSLTNAIDFAKLEAEVKEEKNKIELNQLLANQGLTEHVKNSFTYNGQYFAHQAGDIDSGFLTDNLEKISLYVKLSEMQRQIVALQNVITNNTQTLEAHIVDNFNNEYAIVNNATINVFAGFYTDSATMSPKGEIVDAQLYLRIRNSVPTQIYSLMPGNASTVVAGDYGKIPVGFIESVNNKQSLPLGIGQTYGQIAYLRTRNIINNYDLYKDNKYASSPHTNTISPDFIDGAVQTKNVVHIAGNGSVETVALNKANVGSFVAATTDHPLYRSSSANNELKQALQLAAKQLNDIYDSQQSFVSSIVDNKVAFAQSDKFLVGKPTTGCYLTFNAVNNNQLHVATNAVDAFKEIQTNGSALIPILFQYRMTDAIGNIGGDATTANTDLSYTKRIGIDILLNGQQVKFDLEVSAKYSPNALTTNNIPRINTVDSVSNTPSLI